MKHNKNRKFGRERNVRTALLRSLARALILEEGITTTEAKAKSLRPFVEKLVSHSRTDTVANRRLVASRLGNDTEATAKLFAELGPRYQSRPGGYTRIVRTRIRQGDAAVEARIAFV